jgi:hypothetical protein
VNIGNEVHQELLTSETINGWRDSRFLAAVRVVALIAAVAGGIGSVGVVLVVGQRNPSWLLLALFVIWVLSPFAVLVLANVVSTRWSAFNRAMLYGGTLALTLGSLAIYGDVVLRPPKSATAFRFLVVPLGSWLLMALLAPAAAVITRRLQHKGP